MSPSQIITYLTNLADDFDLQQRHTESIYLREAAALVASHTAGELRKLTMTLGDQVFEIIAPKQVFEIIAPKPIEFSNALLHGEVPQTMWERLAKQ